MCACTSKVFPQIFSDVSFERCEDQGETYCLRSLFSSIFSIPGLTKYVSKICCCFIEHILRSITDMLRSINFCFSSVTLGPKMHQTIKFSSAGSYIKVILFRYGCMVESPSLWFLIYFISNSVSSFLFLTSTVAR